ncbi:MAG: hypothetical protein E7473_09030 [Ruminococcaceae bacterium]|nr:hypothetical protein [Oscillospiraceae bacterium]MBQ7119374.1 hypothetical protein [Oscillospiraceae bacterium]
MTKGKVYKGIAIILFALIFIGAVAVGNSEIFRVISEDEFNFGVFFYILITGLLACIPIYGIGDAVEAKGLCNCGNAEKSNESAPPSSDGWICKKCSVKNDSLSAFCKNCGEYK